ncbi:MAG TPA: bifunctional adenosylcobinamide kinase/adenosylcobinamide-phosphate guanylyltransferase [Candidatus Merdenecus merdavium]|nr:bifunctional adenosylcobinamide kinase/adenosylcobinamide-phosphate guanylyltransferase [Candidatus Merdenecus merdavium]
MILVIGGRNQGKLAYTKERFMMKEEDFIDGRICSDLEIYHTKGIKNFHEYIKRRLKENDLEESFAEDLCLKNPHIIIITDEIGYGIVPVDPFERRYREQVGRICTNLAKQSIEVHRVICGIGQMIKSNGKDPMLVNKRETDR